MLMPEQHNDDELYNTTLKTKELFMYTSPWRFVDGYGKNMQNFELNKIIFQQCKKDFNVHYILYTF